MPQMNKGGKFIFGQSVIRPDGRVQFPPQDGGRISHCFGRKGLSVWRKVKKRTHF